VDYLELISGDRKGAVAALLRGLLRAATAGYRCVIGARNCYYDFWRTPDLLPIPVISVGNLTVGGTGKTPMAIWLCRHLLDRGYKPAVLSRGYKASEEGLADELLMISRRCPKAVAVAHPNRLAAGRLAIDRYGVDVAVLDDGFQHRRVGRDLDIVLIDATRPFGFGHLLPRGLLREPIKSLMRADVVVLTRCDQCDEGVYWRIKETVRRFNRSAPVLRSFHQTLGVTDLSGRSMPWPQEVRVGALAGIAWPEAFAMTLARKHLAPAATLWVDDHHVYCQEEVEPIAEWMRSERLDVVLTTEKDAVKLEKLQADWPARILVVRIEVEFMDDDAKILADRIAAVLAEAPQGRRDRGEQPT